MANLRTTPDLIAAVLRNCGELTDGTSDKADDALEYLDMFHRAFHAGGNELNMDFSDVWTWAKAQYPGVLILNPPYKTGGVTLTLGSPNGTFSTPPSGSLAGWYLRIPGRAEAFRIKTHITPFAAFVLDSEYTDKSVAAGEFVAFQTDYNLVPASSDLIIRLVMPMLLARGESTQGSPEVHGIELSRFQREFPLSGTPEGTPTHFCQLYETDGLITVRMNAFPTEKMRVEYEYVPIPTALENLVGSIPRLPHIARPIMVNAATAKIMLDKQDDRADAYAKWAIAGLGALRLQTRRSNAASGGENRGRLVERKSSDFTSRRRFQ